MERILEGPHPTFQVVWKLTCVPALCTVELFTSTLEPKGQAIVILLRLIVFISNQKQLSVGQLSCGMKKGALFFGHDLRSSSFLCAVQYFSRLNNISQ